MDNGWETSAAAWIADMGERGDFGRRYVLDPVMLPLALKRKPKRALDVGCGEGRFCRMLNEHGVETIGVDPTPSLLARAREMDRAGEYVEGKAGSLPFRDASFDLVVSYLTLIDIPDIDAAIPEMARVLKPGGALLIANLTSFTSACADDGWVKNGKGERLHYRVDNYLSEHELWIEYRGIRIRNYHRPLGAYMKLLLGQGLQLTHFDEPAPTPDAPAKAANYKRAPWFMVMEWTKPA